MRRPKTASGGGSLSSRFASISTKPAGGKKKTPVKGQNNKDVANKGKPQQRNGKKQQNKKGGGGVKLVVTLRISLLCIFNADKREAKKPANKDDLDMEMDKCKYP